MWTRSRDPPSLRSSCASLFSEARDHLDLPLSHLPHLRQGASWGGLPSEGACSVLSIQRGCCVGSIQDQTAHITHTYTRHNTAHITHTYTLHTRHKHCTHLIHPHMRTTPHTLHTSHIQPTHVPYTYTHATQVHHTLHISHILYISHTAHITHIHTSHIHIIVWMPYTYIHTCMPHTHTAHITHTLCTSHTHITHTSGSI